jgi:hypothetical protein
MIILNRRGAAAPEECGLRHGAVLWAVPVDAVRASLVIQL